MSEVRLIDANALLVVLEQRKRLCTGVCGDLGGAISGVIKLIDNAPTVAERPQGECKTCKHYKPIMQREMFGYSPRGDGYCEIRRMTQDGELEINVNDDFYCKYYERGDENGKS